MIHRHIVLTFLVTAISFLLVGTISCESVEESNPFDDLRIRAEQGDKAAQQRSRPQPDPTTQLPERLVTHEQMLKWSEEQKNWDRWGPDDDRGTLNLITPEKTKAAVALVTEGISVRLYHFPDPINLDEPMPDTSNMRVLNQHWIPGQDPEATEIRGAALDAISFATHDGGNSHIDALCHYPVKDEGYTERPQRIYGGRPMMYTGQGCMGGASIDKMGPGYVTRGVLIDMPLLKGVPYLEKSQALYVEDLEAWEEFSGITIGSGDAVFLRTGRWARREAEGPWNYGGETAGLHASILPWLKERDIAILGGDAVADAQPSGVVQHNRPIHDMLIPMWGTPTIDNGYYLEVAEVAARLQRWEFMVSWTMMQIPNGTATPFMGLATF